MWPYYRNQYYARRDALGAFEPKLLSHPVIALALTQIDLAHAAIDNVVALHIAQTGDEED